MKEELSIDIDVPEVILQTWELRVTCGMTSLIVARSANNNNTAQPWCIKSGQSTLDRQTTYATIEEARDEAVRSVLFRERKRLFEHALAVKVQY